MKAKLLVLLFLVVVRVSPTVQEHLCECKDEEGEISFDKETEIKEEMEEEYREHHLNTIYENPAEALPWHIIFGVGGLISPLLIFMIVINRLYFKMTRIGKEQTELKMLLTRYGFEEHDPLVQDLLRFYY